MIKLFYLLGGILIFAFVVSVSHNVQAKSSNSSKKVTICHETSSAKNPFVKIKIAEAGWLAGHKKNHDDDFIVTSAKDCPKKEVEESTKGKGGTAATPQILAATLTPPQEPPKVAAERLPETGGNYLPLLAAFLGGIGILVLKVFK